MTDIKDIEVLREECAQWVKETIGDVVDTRMALNGDGNDYMSWDMSVIWLAWLHLSGNLKAERQRCDEYKGQLELEQHHSKTLSGTVDIVDGQRDHWMERALKAEKEISVIKASLVPIYQVEGDVQKNDKGELISMTWHDVSLEQANIGWGDYGLQVRTVYKLPRKLIDTILK